MCGSQSHLKTSSNWLDDRRQASFQASEAGLQPDGHLPIGDGHEENKGVPWQRPSRPTIKTFQSHFCMLLRKIRERRGAPEQQGNQMLKLKCSRGRILG
jgi:hypothetical protein